MSKHSGMNLTQTQSEHKLLSLPARILPGCIPPGQEIFAIGDVHGQADLLAGTLDEIVNIPRSPGTKRVIVLLGDLIDCGPDGPSAVALAMDAMNLAAADEVAMLPGNHDWPSLMPWNLMPILTHGFKTVERA